MVKQKVILNHNLTLIKDHLHRRQNHLNLNSNNFLLRLQCHLINKALTYSVKPISDSINEVTKKLLDGAGVFKVSFAYQWPKSWDLLFKDKISYWRAVNTAKSLQKGEKKINSDSVAVITNPTGSLNIFANVLT